MTTIIKPAQNFDIVAFARKATINPVDYALATGQINRVDWSSLTDHELRYCNLPVTQLAACQAASAEMENRLGKLIQSGITLGVIHQSVFLPRLIHYCEHASSSLKSRVEEVSLPVLLAALDDQKSFLLAASLLRSYWKNKEYEDKILPLEKYFEKERNKQLDATIKAGLFEAPLLWNEKEVNRWKEYTRTHDLSGLSKETLISLTDNSWWKIRALDELGNKASLKEWFSSPLWGLFNSLSGEIRSSIMVKLHQKLTEFEEVRSFGRFLSFIISSKEGEKAKLQERALRLAETPTDVKYVKENYQISDEQAMNRLLEIQLVLESGEEK